MNSFTFNGTKRDYLVILRGRQIPLWGAIDREMLSVAGMVGAHHVGTSVQPKRIKIPVLIESKNLDELEELKEDLMDWLVTEKAEELIFDDRPERSYYAMLEDVTEIETLIRVGIGYLHFVCPDPYKYGRSVTRLLLDDTIVVNEGTASALPVFKLEALKSSTYAMVSDGEDYMMVGKPHDVIETPYVKYQRIFYDTANNMTGWTAHNSVDGGIVSGQMETTGNRFQALNYGSGTGWHGPAIKKSLSESLGDFRMTAFVAMFNSTRSQVGRIEIYLLDVNGEAVAKVALKDLQSSRSLTVGEARAGSNTDNHFLINEAGDKDGAWNNFNGHLRIEREGNKWEAYFAKVESGTGRHHTRRTVSWIDTGNRFDKRIAQVAIHMGQHGTNVPVIGGVYSINVFKINHEPEGIPYIVEKDDVITFDSINRKAYINGESVPFDFGTKFLQLHKGANNLAILPEDTYTSSVEFRNRYK